MTRTIASHAFVCAVAVLLGTGTETRTQGVAEPHITVLKAAKLLDIRKGNYIENAAVLIDGQRIKEAGSASAIEPHAGKDGANSSRLGRVCPESGDQVSGLSRAGRSGGCTGHSEGRFYRGPRCRE